MTTENILVQQQTGLKVEAIVKIHILKKIMLLMCELNKDIAETGMWTNIFRVEITSHVDHGNTF